MTFSANKISDSSFNLPTYLCRRQRKLRQQTHMCTTHEALAQWLGTGLPLRSAVGGAASPRCHSPPCKEYQQEHRTNGILLEEQFEGLYFNLEDACGNFRRSASPLIISALAAVLCVIFGWQWGSSCRDAPSQGLSIQDPFKLDYIYIYFSTRSMLSSITVSHPDLHTISHQTDTLAVP